MASWEKEFQLSAKFQNIVQPSLKLESSNFKLLKLVKILALSKLIPKGSFSSFLSVTLLNYLILRGDLSKTLL